MVFSYRKREHTVGMQYSVAVSFIYKQKVKHGVSKSFEP